LRFLQAAEALEVERMLTQLMAVPKGSKKAISSDMYKAYHPKMVEATWYDW
jgi:valyl-tRNA synthetase